MLRYTPIQAKEQVVAKVAKMIQSLEKRGLAIIVASQGTCDDSARSLLGGMETAGRTRNARNASTVARLATLWKYAVRG